MAPSTKGPNDKLKQKSLMSFFEKSGGSTSKPKLTQGTTPRKPSNASSAPSSDVLMAEPKTPETKSRDKQELPSSAAASSTSSTGSSYKDTPPSSDPIDVDMLSSDEESHPVASRNTGRKRKVVLEDSDEEKVVAPKKRLTRYRSTSPSGSKDQVKKIKLAKALSEDDEGADDDEGKGNDFAQRLTQFKNSSRKGRKRSTADDDDFIVPSDSEDDAKSVKSTSSRRSSRTMHSMGELEDEDERPRGKSSNKITSSKPSKKSPATPLASEGGFTFLTAAEQRAQEKKNDKKAAEEAYSFLQDVRDKDGRRPGEPGYDPRTLFIPSKAWKEFTPFERQIKQNHYDTILFFQKGKFLELYEDDARIGHQEFDLKLTSRVKMSMVGVPEMSFNFWAAKFLGKGYKVGRVDQAETALGAEMRLAAAKGKGKVTEDKGKDKIVRRELNKVYTNGTLVDPELLTDENAGHCIAICENRTKDDTNNKFGVCVLDSSTSQFDLSSFEDDVCRTKLETLMRQIRPKELLYTKGTLSVSTTRLLKSVLPASCLWTGLREVEGFDYDNTLRELKELYPAGSDDDEEMEGSALPQSVPAPIREMLDCRHAINALGLMIWYLRQLNIDKDILSMRNFNVYDPMKKGQGLVLDGQSLAHLEVLLNNEGAEEGTLLKLLNRCMTPSGKRLFRIWLCMPLRDIAGINARLDAVQDLIANPPFETQFAELVKRLPDLERIVSRIHAKNCTVRDFLKVLASFKRLSRGLSKLGDESEGFDSKTTFVLLRGAPDLVENVKHLEKMFKKPSSEKDDELIPEEGQDEEYDKIMSEVTDLEQDLDASLKKFETKLGCKLAYWHSAVGNKEIYLVETAAGQKGIPNDWTKSGATKAKTRYVVGSLQSKIRQLKEARENRNTAIKTFKYRLFSEFDADRAIWLRAVRVLAELDCLISLARSSVAIGEPSCRPTFVDGDKGFIDFEELRHPTLCLSTNLKTFIPNDIKLGGDVGNIALLTGPNMAGKSTLMRMTATGVIMAQLGMLVPATKARLCPVDSIITRMGAYDNMFSSSSTFKVELDECCKILRDATPKSLVILDELGRGTSTYDGMAIASAVLHQLATHTLPLSFFATHYGSLTDDFSYHPNIRNMHMSTIVDEEKRDLVFLFKLVEGAATSSFGTHVANLAGVPLKVVDRADVVSKAFAQQFKQRLQDKQKNSAAAKMPLHAQADFAFLVKLTQNLNLSDDPVRGRETLLRLKDTVRRYV
ncbi:hypothetical protein AX16_004399 [Volvariella volvacea WC 439]|nr:hypothetical protein AX16_004399 [Volvariella volvacea WC 439]